jgi:hypothetical protein
MSQILSLENDAPAFATERRGFLKSGAAITALATVAAAVATATRPSRCCRHRT